METLEELRNKYKKLEEESNPYAGNESLLGTTKDVEG